MNVIALTLVPAVAAILGAVAAAYGRPGPTLTSALQHVAAGVVFAATATEILPSLKHEGAAWPVLVGGAAGVLVMLLIREVERRVKGPVGLMSLVGVDILVDGLVLGLAFAAGEDAGLLLTVALTLEVLFLGLSAATGLAETVASPARAVLLTSLLVLLLPVGAAAAIPLAGLPEPVLTGFFAFGLVALLYLVTEELLLEAHERPEPSWVTAMFFVGFLLLLLLEEALA